MSSLKNTIDDNKLNISRLTLNFNDADIEDNFKKEYFRKSLSGFRFSFITVTILYSAFGWLDYFTSVIYFKEFMFVRYIIVLPVLLSVFLFSFHKNFIYVWQKLLSFCFFISGLGIIYMLIKNPENIYYYGGMFLIFMGGYFFIKLHFLWALIPGILLILVYNISAVFLSNQQFEYLIITNAFYISANLIGLFALYNIELLERMDFYRQHLLYQKQQEIIQINKNLDNKVKERTRQLKRRNDELIEEIEHRKEVEEKLLIAKEKAIESDNLKSAFLSNMSHEIRTPMNGILGFIDLLQDSQISREIHDQYLEIVRKSSNRLLDTINDIIEISKIESNQTSLNYTVENISEILEFHFNFFKPEAESKKLKFTFTNELNNNFIKIDRNKMESVLTNLIKNALKFTKVGSIEFGCSQKDNLLSFYIKDTGIGIDENRLDSIFNRFEQGDIGINRGYEGSGLGLSIAKAYSEMLGGNLWVESEKNIGSTFYFTVIYNPVTNLSEIEKSEKTDTRSLKKNETEKVILVAEDDDVSFTLLEKMLANEKFTILRAKNGKEALLIFNENPQIQLILMDVKMPEMDGLEATRQIRKKNSTIPIIAQTAFALIGDKEKILEAGCTDYVSKPLNFNELDTKIEIILSGK